jgi:hypothetical protein
MPPSTVIFYPLFFHCSLLSSFQSATPGLRPAVALFPPSLTILYVAVVSNLAARLEESAHLATVPRSFSVGGPYRTHSVLVQAGHSNFRAH